MTKEFKVRILVKPQAPPTLDEILEKFRQGQDDMERAEEILKNIKDSEKRFNDGNVADDLNINAKFGMDCHLPKGDYFTAFIEYMGLTLYWHKKQNFDFAWSYYAKAQYYLGIHNSWDYARDYLTKKEIDSENKAKGGRSKNAELRKLLRAALAQVIVEKKPLTGWKSKIQLFNVAVPAFRDVCKELGVDNEFIDNNYYATVYSWLRTSGELALLFDDHKANKPP